MKADLNLLPKKKSNISAKNVVLLSIVSIIVLGVVGYFFVYMPNAEKNRISKEIEEKEIELAKYDGLDEELTQLNKEINELKGMLEAVDGITSEYVKMTEKLKSIGQAMPVEMIINDFTYSENIVEMEAQGLYEKDIYTDIARFMVNLRNIDDVESVRLVSVNYDEKDEAEGHVYKLIIHYNEPSVDTESADTESVDTEEEGEE